MIKFSIGVLALLSAFNGIAQVIPNGDFESWSNGEPQGWATYNSVATLMGLSSPPVVQWSPAPQGNSAIKMTNMYSDLAADFIPGFAYLGSLNPLTGQGSLGVPFTQTPLVFSGTYQHHVINPGDTAVIACMLTKWDAALGGQVEVATAAIISTNEVSNWMDFAIPFVYNTSDTPDTMSIYLYAFGGDGASLSVDNLHFDASIGVNEQKDNLSELQVYPNPAQSEIWVDSRSLGQGPYQLSVLNAMGQLIYNTTFQSAGLQHLDIENWPAGEYVIHLFNELGSTCKRVLKD